MSAEELTADEVRALLDYAPHTGVFSWARSRVGCRKGGRAGWVGKKGYRFIGLRWHKHVAEHRLAWLHVYGEWPDGCLDHINGVVDDNRIENLREASVAENGQNMRKRSDNTSGYIGVKWHAKGQLWQARITVNGKEISLGYRKAPEEAYQLYLAGKAKYHTFQPTPRELAA